MTTRRKPMIAVIGAGRCSENVSYMAAQIGQYIAEHGGVVVCGGLGGVMEAAAKGARSAGGVTIGILPTNNKNDANEYIDYPIVTGMGEGRNMIVAKSADAVIALPGEYGTLIEMAFALHQGIPLVAVSSWEVGQEVHRVNDPVEAAKLALELALKRIYE